jgi:hypothetical protein
MFDNLKKSMHERIARKTIISNLDGETVLMKYGGLPGTKDWHRIYPPVVEVEENGQTVLKWNIVNLVFGGRRNIVKLLYLIGIIALMFIGVSDLLSQCNNLAHYVSLHNITLSISPALK